MSFRTGCPLHRSATCDGCALLHGADLIYQDLLQHCQSCHKVFPLLDYALAQYARDSSAEATNRADCYLLFWAITSVREYSPPASHEESRVLDAYRAVDKNSIATYLHAQHGQATSSDVEAIGSLFAVGGAPCAGRAPRP
eukprot:m.71553 g.71553  ORF g.71553 m.71553 type:complete len:140 (+) comp7639_c0_seq2:841-1260(+)